MGVVEGEWDGNRDALMAVDLSLALVREVIGEGGAGSVGSHPRGNHLLLRFRRERVSLAYQPERYEPRYGGVVGVRHVGGQEGRGPS